MATPSNLAQDISRGGLSRLTPEKKGKKAIQQIIVKWICFLCAGFSIIATVGIIFILLSESFPFFKHTSLIEFVTGTKWQMVGGEMQFGILPLLTGTLLITFGSGLVSIPLGLFVGIYLSEYAHANIRKILKPLLELLAGVPSVVFGYFALSLVTPALRGGTDFLGNLLPTLNPMLPEFRPANAAAGAIVVGFMTLPLVASLCEDALNAVPKVLREAAFGLGCTQAEVVTKIVIPSALSGIIASFILALSRAVGETMAVTIAAGATPQLTINPGDEVMTMTAQIVNVSKGDISRGDIVYQSIFAIGLTLFVLTLILNIFAMRLIRRRARAV
ncbi:phosphate ABC transporter permease subunit PstC [Kamptonema cortianum]|nr:phosphate ABC transporter permease subunit PstC [Geitlerinema splendidum]MDK3157618.1 phosphate ABC transporter permease subunit PstC [Kamptonema cortianum]